MTTELPPGFQPVQLVAPAPQPEPAPKAEKPKKVDDGRPKLAKAPSDLDVVTRFNIVRGYYVGALQVAWLEERTHHDGHVTFQLGHHEGHWMVPSIEAADQWVIGQLKGQPREVPLFTDRTLNGFRVIFDVGPGVQLGPLPLPPAPAQQPAPPAPAPAPSAPPTDDDLFQ